MMPPGNNHEPQAGANTNRNVRSLFGTVVLFARRQGAHRLVVAAELVHRKFVPPRDVLLHDLSETGCRVAGLTGAARYDHVMIGLAGLGPRPARVIWTHGDQAGCHFDEPLTDDAVALAQRGGKVIEAQFSRDLAPPPSQPATTPYSARTRLAVMVAAAALGWALLVAIAWIGLGLTRLS